MYGWKLKLKIYERQDSSPSLASRDQHYDKIVLIWSNIQVDYIQSVYSSIPKRIRKVQSARGYITKY